MGRTRIKLDFVIEHDGDRLFPSFELLDFIEGGILAIAPRRARRSRHAPPRVNAIEPGARLVLSLPRKMKR